MITTALAFVSPAHGAGSQSQDKGDPFPKSWRGTYCDVPGQKAPPFDRNNPEAGISAEIQSKHCTMTEENGATTIEGEKMTFWEGGCDLELGRYDKDTDTYRSIWMCGSEGSQWAKSSIFTYRKGILVETFRTTDFISE